MTNVKLTQENSIVLTGFMGVGKTTIGELIAQKLERPFVDIDKVIEKQFQMPIPDIFATFGEKTFREKEKSIIFDYCQQKEKIISLGGGAFLQEEIREVCLSTCTVLFLDISWEAWKKQRLQQIIDNRPVLQGLSPEEMKELFFKRQATYANHHLKFQTDELGPEEIADRIMNELNKAWK